MVKKPKPQLEADITIWLPGKLPGFNEMIAGAKERNAGYCKYAQDKLFAEQGRLMFLRCNYRHIPKPIPYRVWADFTWVEQNKKRDPDNIASAKKIVLDTMVLAGILKDDGWKQVAGFCDHFEINRKNPGVRICLKKAN